MQITNHGYRNVHHHNRSVRTYYTGAKFDPCPSPKGNQVSKRKVPRCPALVKWLVYQSQDERNVEVPTYFDHGGA
jgi:hypothetical protein